MTLLILDTVLVIIGGVALIFFPNRSGGEIEPFASTVGGGWSAF
jgi:hypothetical protein